MNVGLGCGGNAQSVLARDALVLVDVAFRIDHNGFAGALTANKISVLSQAWVKDLSQEHY
jgi:hypothetical protein